MLDRIIRRSLAAGALSAASVTVAATAAGAAPAPVHIRGTIASLTGGALVVRTASGDVDVALAKTAKIAGVVHGRTADITAGTFIGTANVPQGAASRALEVVVFPPSMKGTGLGDYPWDLPGGGAEGHGSTMTNGTVGGAGHGSTMTNGTVGGAAHGSTMTNGTMHASTMTNGTVHAASGGDAKTVSVDYGKGSRTIVIGPQTPVVRVMPATRAALVPGAHVFVVASGGPGPKTAGFVIVGENGTVPPM